MTKQERTFILVGLLVLTAFFFMKRRKGMPSGGDNAWPNEVTRQVQH